jgi:hypothetical protein
VVRSSYVTLRGACFRYETVRWTSPSTGTKTPPFALISVPSWRSRRFSAGVKLPTCPSILPSAAGPGRPSALRFFVQFFRLAHDIVVQPCHSPGFFIVRFRFLPSLPSYFHLLFHLPGQEPISRFNFRAQIAQLPLPRPSATSLLGRRLTTSETREQITHS